MPGIDWNSITEEQFVGLAGAESTSGPGIDTFDDYLQQTYQADLGAEIRNLGQDYSINHLRDGFGNVALLYSGRVVGVYDRTALLIREEHRGRQLGVALVLAAYEFRDEVPSRRSLTHAGARTLQKAWKVARGKLKNPWP